MRLTIDYETRSACDLKACGAWVYGEDPTTEIICCAVKTDDLKPRVWMPKWALDRLTDPPFDIIPDDQLFHMIQAADTIEAHNAEFEVAVWTGTAIPKYGWPAVPHQKIRCSASKASMHALPRSLAGGCKALNLDAQKDKEGYNLMMQMCKPRKQTAAEKKLAAAQQLAAAHTLAAQEAPVNGVTPC